MIAARTTSQAAEPAPRRSVLDVLLLGGMDWTNKHPAFGVVGLVAMYVLAAVLEQLV